MKRKLMKPEEDWSFDLLLGLHFYLFTRMLTRDFWMLCLIWLLGWDGLDEGALGAGGTSKFRVSFRSAGAGEGFGPDDEASTGLDEGWGANGFFGMMKAFLPTVRAPVSWWLGSDVDGVSETVAWQYCSVLRGVQGCVSEDRLLLTGSFGVSGSLTGWEDGATSAAESSRDWFRGATASTPCVFSILAVKKRQFCHYKDNTNLYWFVFFK